MPPVPQPNAVENKQGTLEVTWPSNRPGVAAEVTIKREDGQKIVKCYLTIEDLLGLTENFAEAAEAYAQRLIDLSSVAHADYAETAD